MSSIYTSKLESFEPRARQLMTTHPQDDGTDDDNLAASVLSNAPKLSSKYNSFVGIGQTKRDELWTIRGVVNGEEQLYAKGKCVYWTRNSLIIKSFNFTDQVIRVFWTQFNSNDHICVALTSGLSVFDHLGRHYQMLLPFSYKEMYTTNAGLLIERNYDTLSEESSLPTIFALTHPTREVSPILFKTSSNLNQSNDLAYSISSFMSIVGCHPSLPLCLMYNSQECQHSIWRVRTTTPCELDEFNRMNENETTNTTANNTFSQSNCSFKTPDHGVSHSSLNVSSKQKSSLMQNSSANTINFSPKLNLKSRHSNLGNLAASRLGVGHNQMGIGGGDPTTNVTTAVTTIKSFKETQNTFNTVSTPNRNRLINYLRDNIDEPILPELTLDQVWTDSTSNSLRAAKFFCTTDLVGDKYMVIVIPASSQVRVLRHNGFIKNDFGQALSLGRSICIPAQDAASVESMNMMVVIDTAKNLALYSGFDLITPITIPQVGPNSAMRTMPTSSPANVRGTTSVIDMSPIQASSARKRTSMGERNSIGSEFSFQAIFQTLSPVPHAGGKPDPHKATSSPVCLGDNKKIEQIVDRTLFLLGSNNQRYRVEIPSVCQTNYVKKLLDAMKSVVSRDFGLSIVCSWYQTRRSATQSLLMRAQEEMHLYKNWFLSSLGIEGILFGEQVQISSTKDIRLKNPYSSPRKRSRRQVDTNLYLVNINTLFYSMHLVLEDLITTPSNYENAYSLAELLLVIACLLKHDEYAIYYWSKFPCLVKTYAPIARFLETLCDSVNSLYRPSFFTKKPPSANEFITRLIMLSKLPEVDSEKTKLNPYPNIHGVTDNTFTLIALSCAMFGVDTREALVDLTPTSANYPTLILIDSRPTRSERNDQKVVELLVGLGKDRNYLSRLPSGLNLYLWDAILNCRESPPSNWSEACYNMIGRMDLVDLISGRAKTLGEGEDETLKLLFPDDIRVSEAHRMLASDAPVEFSITQRQGATEEESRDETHRHLYLLNVRTMAMPPGRGAICLRTYSPVIGESFEVPRLELSGRSSNEERNIDYTHDISVYPWPYFHNGVAAGLTICSSTANNIIDSTWINYNRPKSNVQVDHTRDRDCTTNINNEHAGFLFALGLNGHLEKLSLMALHDYLCQNNDLTKVAILLGMAAAKRGSRDTNIIKVLSIHVDALLPPNSTELDVSASVHTASIIGVGLLYQNSGDSHISRVLLEEIGRLPGPEANSHTDRESYSLSAGLAFGIVNLCKGGSTTISSSDQLRLYMLGGKRKSLTVYQEQRYKKQDCHLGEAEYINTHITSPGGTLGLALMYHRSGNVSVANWMRAPDTQTLLEYVRPDFLVLRMLGYGLIMWDGIKPSEDYIDSHIPKIVSTHAFQRNSMSSNNQPSLGYTGFDYELISQAYCNIVAGCCMSIAMRYAGTANRDAYKTIYKHTKMLIALSNKPALVEQAGRPCIETCLNVLVTSLAVVMAGTGDLGVLRVCRYLRSRITQSCVFYGSHMATHLALGILFLGACRYTFSTSPEAIGALVCALYPIYPNHCSDNRYHLQALRHLYVLAAEPRLLIPRDILTNKPVYVNVIINQRMNNGKVLELKLRSPCLVPEVETIEKVCLEDDRYWRIEIKDREVLKKCLFQEHGYLSVKQKAHLSNNQLVQNIETYILQNMVRGEMKSLKSSALAECVKTDRVEQFTALNKLLDNAKNVKEKFLCLVLEQLFIANTLNKCNDPLQPVIDGVAKDLYLHSAEEKWTDYLENQRDWTKTEKPVAHYMALNNLQFCNMEPNPAILKNCDLWLHLFG